MNDTEQPTETVETKTTPPLRRYRKWTYAQRWEILRYADQHTSTAAAKKYGVSPGSISEWRKWSKKSKGSISGYKHAKTILRESARPARAHTPQAKPEALEDQPKMVYEFRPRRDIKIDAAKFDLGVQLIKEALGL